MSALGATKSTDNAVKEAVNRVLRLLSVGSKRFLTTKVDRSVTGLIAQQQCVGPLHTPLADCAVTALSYDSIKGMLDAEAMAQLATAECLTNLAFAQVTCLEEV